MDNEQTWFQGAPTLEDGTVVPTALKRKHDELKAALKDGRVPIKGLPGKTPTPEVQQAEPQEEQKAEPPKTELPTPPQKSVAELLAEETKQPDYAESLDKQQRMIEQLQDELRSEKKRAELELPQDVQLDEDTQRSFGVLMDGLKAVQKEVRGIKKSVSTPPATNGVGDEIAKLRADTFAANIKSRVSDWDQLNNDMGFVAFLAGVVNPLDKLHRPYAATLKEARAAGDVEMAAAVVAAYRNTAQPPPKADNLEMPKSSTPAAPAPTAEKIKLSDYLAWCRKCNRNMSKLDMNRTSQIHRQFHDAFYAGNVDMTA